MTYMDCLNEIVRNYYDVEPDFADDPITVYRDSVDDDFLVGVQLYDACTNEKQTFVHIGSIGCRDGAWVVTDILARGVL